MQWASYSCNKELTKNHDARQSCVLYYPRACRRIIITKIIIAFYAGIIREFIISNAIFLLKSYILNTEFDVQMVLSNYIHTFSRVMTYSWNYCMSAEITWLGKVRCLDLIKNMPYPTILLLPNITRYYVAVNLVWVSVSFYQNFEIMVNK